MNANVGPTDKIIRLVLAAIALIAAFSVGLGTGLGILLLVVGIVLGVTAFVGFCPIYRLLGLSTRKGEH